MIFILPFLLRAILIRFCSISIPLILFTFCLSLEESDGCRYGSISEGVWIDVWCVFYERRAGQMTHESVVLRRLLSPFAFFLPFIHLLLSLAFLVPSSDCLLHLCACFLLFSSFSNGCQLMTCLSHSNSSPFLHPLASALRITVSVPLPLSIIFTSTHFTTE